MTEKSKLRYKKFKNELADLIRTYKKLYYVNLLTI